MWGKPIFIAIVRKSRYTFELIEKAESFTVGIPYGTSIPVVENCNMYYECIIVYKQAIDKQQLLPEINQKMYADSDYHTIY